MHCTQYICTQSYASLQFCWTVGVIQYEAFIQQNDNVQDTNVVLQEVLLKMKYIVV